MSASPLPLTPEEETTLREIVAMGGYLTASKWGHRLLATLDAARVSAAVSGPEQQREVRTYNSERSGYDVMGPCWSCGSPIRYFVDEDGTPHNVTPLRSSVSAQENPL